MANTWEDLKKYIGDDGYENDSLVEESFSLAQTLVLAHVGTAEVPADVLDLCYLIVGADLFNRRSAPNGVMNSQYATADGIGTEPYRIARDPLAGAYKILGKWVLPF
jgi:hypothetical protein